MKSQQKGVISIVIIGLVLIVAVGVVSYTVFFNDDGSVDTSATNITSTDTAVANPTANPDTTSGSYPALYKQYNLPEYPGAIIVSDGRTSDNLADGVTLKLTTSDDVETVGAYYADAFASLPGWVFTPPKYSSGSLYGATAEKADASLRYQLTVSNSSDHSQISITFFEI